MERVHAVFRQRGPNRGNRSRFFHDLQRSTVNRVNTFLNLNLNLNTFADAAEPSHLHKEVPWTAKNHAPNLPHYLRHMMSLRLRRLPRTDRIKSTIKIKNNRERLHKVLHPSTLFRLFNVFSFV